MNNKIYNDGLTYSPPKITNSYYQICQFMNKKTKLFGIRKIIFNEKFDILQIIEKEYNSQTITKFVKNNATNKYKIFPTNDIKHIGIPNTSDLIEVQSDLLN